MTCPTCNQNIPSNQAVCPRCGRFVGLPIAEAPSGLRPVHWIVIGSLTIFIGGLALFVSFFAKHWNEFANTSRRKPPITLPTKQREYISTAVEHGKIVQPSQLHAHGILYLVPMGAQSISVKTLADYYDQKFKMQVHVLAPVTPDAKDCNISRKQCSAEDMLLTMRRAYPAIARDPQSVMIALTNEDLYPRNTGPKFISSVIANYRFAIISTHSFVPFDDDDSDPEDVLTCTKQILTKHIAVLYFHLPQSFDDTSLLYRDMEPDAGPDDIYESDLHSEESANGRHGTGWPCIFASYSYATGKIQHPDPPVDDCENGPALSSPQIELFDASLATGEFEQHAMDFQLHSTPPIEFKRAYLSRYLQPFALGIGTNHNLNNWLNSDGGDKLTYIDVIHENGERDTLRRITPGHGFQTDIVFENKTDAGDFFGARATWETNHFKIQYRDGSGYTYLPCADNRCFCSGYYDNKGNFLRYDRNQDLALRAVSAQQGGKLQFASDSQSRITRILASNGSKSSYAYNSAGELVRVDRPDGQSTLYTYDSAHHMTTISVVRASGQTPQLLLTNTYNSDGRLIRQSYADGTTYKIDYEKILNDRVSKATLTTVGKVSYFTISLDNYVVRAPTVRFPFIEKK